MRVFPESSGPMAHWPRVKAVQGIEHALRAVKKTTESSLHHTQLTQALISSGTPLNESAWKSALMTFLPLGILELRSRTPLSSERFYRNWTAPQVRPCWSGIISRRTSPEPRKQAFGLFGSIQRARRFPRMARTWRMSQSVVTGAGKRSHDDIKQGFEDWTIGWTLLPVSHSNVRLR
jgi:hypothetical protein